MQRPHGNVWFAGGDIAAGFPSWIEGAVESGTLIAKALGDSLARGQHPSDRVSLIGTSERG
jgi:monoamine oxidase